MTGYFPVCVPLLTQEMLGLELWVQYVAFYYKQASSAAKEQKAPLVSQRSFEFIF